MKKIVRHTKSDLMSQVVTYQGVAYFSGQIAWNSRSQSATEQTREILSGIDDLIRLVGATKSDILSASIWLSDMQYFSEMNDVWREWVDPENPPARATVQAELAFPDLKIEIQITAAVQDKNGE